MQNNFQKITLFKKSISLAFRCIVVWVTLIGMVIHRCSVGRIVWVALICMVIHLWLCMCISWTSFSIFWHNIILLILYFLFSTFGGKTDRGSVSRSSGACPWRVSGQRPESSFLFFFFFFLLKQLLKPFVYIILAFHNLRLQSFHRLRSLIFEEISGKRNLCPGLYSAIFRIFLKEPNRIRNMR